ncbi:MAG: glycoside hydrolase family 5 protein [Mycobacteriales bacterium]
MRGRTASAVISIVTALGLGAWGAFGAVSQATPARPSAKPPIELHVSGNHLVDATGRVVQLNGFSHSGSEYACAQGWGIFDGPVDNAAIDAMTTWHPHVVRIPLNEDCWLGINGVDPRYGGAAYRSAIKAYAARLESHGLDVDLDLHVSAPGKTLPDSQEPMPDVDHSPAFWKSVAKTFRNDHAVIFELFNEPHDVSWSCWLNGCTTNGYRAAGMQQLLDAVRSTGATNVVLAGGLGWSSDLSKWLAHEPHDPMHQLGAVSHVYNFAACNTETCWNQNDAKVARHVPIVTTEFGDNKCTGAYVDNYMKWADAHGVSYLAWTWNTWPCKSGPAIISSYSGQPTQLGRSIRAHFRNRF